jgi:hypothetical protein
MRSFVGLVALKEVTDNGPFTSCCSFFLLNFKLLGELAEILGDIPEMMSNCLEVFELACSEIQTHVFLLTTLAHLEQPYANPLVGLKYNFEVVWASGEMVKIDRK